MKSPVRPELPTASVGSSQAPPAAVDNSAPSAIRPDSTYKSGKVVQTNGATSQGSMPALKYLASGTTALSQEADARSLRGSASGSGVTARVLEMRPLC